LKKIEKKHRGPHDPSKAFEYEMEARTQCTVCQHVKYTTQSDNQLMVMAPVPTGVEAGTDVSLQSCLDGFFADQIIDDLNCPVCNKKQQFVQQKRFKTFPKYLVVVLQRFVFHNWVPKKLEINLTFDTNQEYDFGALMSKGPQADEKLMPQPAESDEVEPELDQNLVN